MLSFFLTRLFQADPDVIVGHNLFGLDLDVLMHRMKQHNIPQWSRIGRLKRKKMPNLQVCTRYCYLSACLPVCLPAYLSACWLSKLCFVCALISVALFAFLPAVIPAHHPGGPRQPQEHGCKPRCSEWASAAGCAAQLTRAHPPSQLRPHRPRPKPGAPPRESVCVCVRESVCCVYVCVKVCESVFVKVNVCACQQSTQGLLTCLLPPPLPRCLLCCQQLGMKRADIEQDQIPRFYGQTDDLLRFVEHVERDAFYNLKLMFKLQILPLMKQITK